MCVFVTGATGFIGCAIVQELITAGHEVLGMARSEAGGKSLIAAGAQVHRGDLEDLESLRSGAAASDGVIHTAFIHDISHASLLSRVRIVLGGLRRGIASSFMRAVVDTDTRAIEALGSALAGSGRPLVVPTGTLGLTPGRLATEEQAPDPGAAGGIRSVPSEEAVLAMASRGVRASVVRLAPAVHDRVKQGLVTRMIALARKKGVSAFAGNGLNRWPAVHRLDAAHLFRLALENGSAGARYHGVAEEGVPLRDIADVIGRRLNVPVVGKPADYFGLLLKPFILIDNPASSTLTQERLGWRPTQPELISDLESAGLFRSVNNPGRGSAKVVAQRTRQSGY